jgi:hypothetical protein
MQLKPFLQERWYGFLSFRVVASCHWVIVPDVSRQRGGLVLNRRNVLEELDTSDNWRWGHYGLASDAASNPEITKPQTREKDVFKTSAVSKKCSEKEKRQPRHLTLDESLTQQLLRDKNNAATNCKLPLSVNTGSAVRFTVYVLSRSLTL